jgi:hypothetical protein
MISKEKGWAKIIPFIFTSKIDTVSMQLISEDR